MITSCSSVERGAFSLAAALTWVILHRGGELHRRRDNPTRMHCDVNERKMKTEPRGLGDGFLERANVDKPLGKRESGRRTQRLSFLSRANQFSYSQRV